MTREELEQIKVGDKLVYTDLWVTKHVEPVHYSALEKYAEL
jgi:hypothetical protein